MPANQPPPSNEKPFALEERRVAVHRGMKANLLIFGMAMPFL
jgi:hypothetical protein